MTSRDISLARERYSNTLVFLSAILRLKSGQSPLIFWASPSFGLDRHKCPLPWDITCSPFIMCCMPWTMPMDMVVVRKMACHGGLRLSSVQPGFNPRSGHAGKSHSGWPGRYINERFFLHACTGLQVTKGVKLENIPAHFGYM